MSNGSFYDRYIPHDDASKLYSTQATDDKPNNVGHNNDKSMHW